MDVDKLRTLLGELVDDPSLQPSNGKTFCNIAAYRVMSQFGVKDIKLDKDGFPPLANEMRDILSFSPNFVRVDAHGSHTAALSGQLVVAARRYDDRGHVAVVYPSPQMYYSGSLQKEQPFVANVGKRCGIIPASEAFPVDLGEAEFYVYNA